MTWKVEFYSEDVIADFSALPRDLQAKLRHITTLMREFGVAQIREPYVKHLQDDLWEMRMKGKDGIARAIYVTAHEKRVVIVHVFRKKTQKTPRKEIKMALERARNVQ